MDTHASGTFVISNVLFVFSLKYIQMKRYNREGHGLPRIALYKYSPACHRMRLFDLF